MNYWTRTCHNRLARLALGGLLAFVGAASAAAAEYHVVAAGDEFVMLVDKSSIYQSGDYTRGWVVTLSSTTDDDDDPIVSALYEFDCSQHQWRIISYTDRDESGTVDQSFDAQDLSWTNVEPSTNSESLQAAICTPSSITEEALPTDDLAELLARYLNGQNSK